MTDQTTVTETETVDDGVYFALSPGELGLMHAASSMVRQQVRSAPRLTREFEYRRREHHDWCTHQRIIVVGANIMSVIAGLFTHLDFESENAADESREIMRHSVDDSVMTAIVESMREPKLELRDVYDALEQGTVPELSEDRATLAIRAFLFIQMVNNPGLSSDMLEAFKNAAAVDDEPSD